MIRRVFALIRQRGWSISEFERRIGSSTGTFNGWRRRGAIPEDRIEEVANVLETSAQYLRGETDDPTPPPTPGMIKRVIEHLAKNPQAWTSGENPELDEMMIALTDKLRGKD